VIVHSPKPKEGSAPFTRINNEALNDTRLSFKARGILAYLLTKPEDWTFDISRVSRASNPDGVKSVTSGLKELEDLGYLIREPLPGRGIAVRNILYEVPPPNASSMPDPSSRKQDAYRWRPDTGDRNPATNSRQPVLGSGEPARIETTDEATTDELTTEVVTMSLDDDSPAVPSDLLEFDSTESGEDPSDPQQSLVASDEVLVVFKHWLTTYDQPGWWKPQPWEIRAVRESLACGFSVQQLETAIVVAHERAVLDPSRGSNLERLPSILRSKGHIDRLLGYEELADGGRTWLTGEDELEEIFVQVRNLVRCGHSDQVTPWLEKACDVAESHGISEAFDRLLGNLHQETTGSLL
jgi:hypothetical protein